MYIASKTKLINFWTRHANAQKKRVSLMSRLPNSKPNLKAIFDICIEFENVIGPNSINTSEEHLRAIETMDLLINEVRGEEHHPLRHALRYLHQIIHTFESKHFPIEKAEPRDILQSFMDEYNLTQADLADCAPQSRISEILSGKRAISKAIAKKLAKRFKVSVDLFL